MNNKKTILLILTGIIIGFFIGRYDFSKIKNPLRNVIIIKNEEELEQLAGKYLYDKELADCEKDDTFFYAHYKTGPGSSKNFKLVCGYYLDIKIHEETVLYEGEWHTLYCSQTGDCVYGERK